MTIGDRVLSPLGLGTVQAQYGYYIYVMLDDTDSLGEFYPNELQVAPFDE